MQNSYNFANRYTNIAYHQHQIEILEGRKNMQKNQFVQHYTFPGKWQFAFDSIVIVVQMLYWPCSKNLCTKKKKNEGENLKCFSQVLETDNRFQTHNIPRRWWWCWLSKLFAIDWRWHCLSVRGSLLFDFHCSLVSCCSSYLEIGNIVFARWENSSA